jgi:NDP-sugar pyrophosphorylase family protein
MKAMIFAAGLGTRLKHITKKIPKALVEINGKPMIERVILKLKSHGVSDLIVNLHHFPEQIKAFIGSKNNFGINISFSEETGQLLETGGGLMKARGFFEGNEPFFVHNVDVLSNIDLSEMWQYHQRHNPLATLFVQKRDSSRYFLFNNQLLLKGWTNVNTGELKKVDGPGTTLTQLAFNGIHVIDPGIFRLINTPGAFSITQSFISLADKYAICGFRADHAKYIDTGKPENLAEAEKLAMILDKKS